MTTLLTLSLLSPAHAGLGRHEPTDDDGPNASGCVTTCGLGPSKRTQVNVHTSRGTVAVNASAALYSAQGASVTIYGEAGVMPTFRDWTAMAGGGALVTVGGGNTLHLVAEAALYAEREAAWGKAPVTTVESHLSVAGHLQTQADVTWALYAEVDPIGTWEQDGLDGAVGVTRTRAPWEGTWHDVRFTLGLELRDSTETQAWVDNRWEDPRDLPDVLPYPTFDVTWQF